MVGIYKITNPKGRIYIGQSIDVKQRWRCYERYTYNCKNQVKLFNSLMKYGYGKHLLEVIVECGEGELDVLENKWKLHFDSVEKGLNHCYWDCASMKGRKHTKASINKIIKSHTGSKRSEETRLKMSLNSGVKGIPRTEKQKKSTSQANMGKIRDLEFCLKRRKEVIQYSLNGDFIKEWGSILEAEERLKIKGISSNCRGNSRMAGKYQWVYKFNNYPLRIKEYKNPTSLPIIQYSLEGDFVKEWSSIHSSIKFFNGGGIQGCLLGKQLTSCGFLWKYKTKNYLLKIPPFKREKIERNKNFIGKISKPITQLTKSGEFISHFPSMKLAEKETGVSAYNISGCVRNKQKTAGGYIWEYQK